MRALNRMAEFGHSTRVQSLFIVEFALNSYGMVQPDTTKSVAERIILKKINHRKMKLGK